MGKKLRKCRRSLINWSKATFKNAAREIPVLQNKLQQALNLPNHLINWDDITKLKASIDRLWKQEESYWNQRSRIKWLQCGDRNTKFFHATTIQRMARNRSERIKDNNGNWLEGQNQIMTGVFDFYSDLYSVEPISSVSECID